MIQNFMKKSYPRLHEFYMHIEEKYREQKKNISESKYQGKNSLRS